VVLPNSFDCTDAASAKVERKRIAGRIHKQIILLVIAQTSKIMYYENTKILIIVFKEQLHLL
jgi:hypothetical protein